MIEVDTRGLSCPIPVVRVKKAIQAHPGEEILVLLDSPEARENISRLALSLGLEVAPTKDARPGILLAPKR